MLCESGPEEDKKHTRAGSHTFSTLFWGGGGDAPEKTEVKFLVGRMDFRDPKFIVVKFLVVSIEPNFPNKDGFLRPEIPCS